MLNQQEQLQEEALEALQAPNHPVPARALQHGEVQAAVVPLKLPGLHLQAPTDTQTAAGEATSRRV
jgi:hypothetical protein